jgi:hypothetical protein
MNRTTDGRRTVVNFGMAEFMKKIFKNIIDYS